MSYDSKATPVGFVFINDGHDWHGGLNYFRSLFLALQSEPECSVRPVAFVGAGADIPAYGFPSNVRIVQHRVFDRGTVPWLANKLVQRLSGAPAVTNRVLRREGIRLLSHGAPTRNRVLRAIGWIPDFQHVHLPQFFPADELVVRNRQYRELIERSDLLVVSSEAALADLQRFAPALAHKGRVLRFSAIRPDVTGSERLDLHATYGLDRPYFYLPNQFWAHKDHLTAIRALAELRQRHPGIRIVCSGSLTDYRNPGHLDKLRAEIDRLGLSAHFLLLGSIPYPHIAQLMLGAVAVVNPSLSEGWSTTVEEAKALGVPLVLSAIAVHREQCQRGEAIFFEPGDSSGLAARLEEQLGGWQDMRRDPSVALEAHRQRTQQFARAYERVVAEAVALEDRA